VQQTTKPGLTITTLEHLVMANPAHTTTAVLAPHSGYVPSQSHRAGTPWKRRDRALLLALIEENQRHIALANARIARANAGIVKLTAELYELDGYRTPN
jgi:hypothetical protein